MVIQGTDRHYRLTFTDPDLITGPNPEGRVDLTGSTIYYRWKKNQDDPNPAEISKSSIVVTEIEILAQAGATLGQADVWLVPSDTDTLITGWHYWDAWAVLADTTRHAKLPQRVNLINAVTDLTSPSPGPTGGPGDGDDVFTADYEQSLPDSGTSTTTVSLGRVPVGASVGSLTAEISEAVDSGSIIVSVLFNSVEVLAVTLNAGTPIYDIDEANTGTYNLDEGDTLEVKVVATAYKNATAVTATLKVNVALARTATLNYAPVVLTSTAAQIAIITTARNYYHDITEDSQVQLPNVLGKGMQWKKEIEANGTHELTWVAGYLWGNTIGVPPDFSAMADNDRVLIDFYAISATEILCSASEDYTPA
jgi:hypothetical protein